MTTVEEVQNLIYRIEVPLPGSPLKYLNSYFLKGEPGEPNYLVDTGFNRKECYEAQIEGLKYIGADIDNLNIINTHFHIDHSGLNNVLRSGEGKIYMEHTDADFLLSYFERINKKMVQPGDIRVLKEGVSLEEFKKMDKNDPSNLFYPDNREMDITMVEDGDKFIAAGREFEFIKVPGHTPGNCMLWSAKDNLMLTGDHVLFDISPNIISWYTMKNSLGSYMDSLKKSLTYDVKTALPGHRKPGDYQDRVTWLIGHHERRMNKCIDVLCNSQRPLTAWEITQRLSWKIRAKSWDEWPEAQKGFALGECLAHLDCLLAMDRIEKIEADPYVLYKAKI